MKAEIFQVSCQYIYSIKLIKTTFHRHICVSKENS